MTSEKSLQDVFLGALCKSKTQVSVFLVNGIKLQGYIEAFDKYVLVLRSVGSQMVFKHAISTIMPIAPMNLSNFIADDSFVEVMDEDGFA